jgi:hypothetical protein
MSARKRLLAVAAAVTMWATIQPGTVSAQQSGVGADGNTRLLWRGTDSRISLWSIAPNGTNFSHVYGPYTWYTPIAITTAVNNYSYVLWRYWDNSIVLWLVDPNLNYVSSIAYGPYEGWVAKGLSVTNDGTSWFRVIWRYYDGTVSVWTVNSSLVFQGSQNYGPYFGYDPGYGGSQ